MAIGRVTQNMMVRSSMAAIETNASRLAESQERLSTGRKLNRPSDSPTDTIAAMRVRAEKAELAQHTRNAEDGLGWLNQLDGAFSSITTQVRRARDLALQGANEGMSSAAAREALAVEVDQLRESLKSAANTQYLGRPVFGGVTAGSQAYDANGDWIGEAGAVNRTIGNGVVIAVNVNGPDVFGVDGASLFDELESLSNSLRAGDSTGIRGSIDALNAREQKIVTTHADVGIRAGRLEGVLTQATSSELTLTARLSDLEDADLIKSAIDVKLQEVAYQSALASSSRILSVSLLDYLR
ncbi:flagellar hook-associated protein FlgL [Nocardioides sp. Bht2]|uniref:flagellar hook-associated protein FlgL n=1 Tax=Nocardioides sp. Bht2 TaxID=3392297 RepID=UPI0039B581AD